MKETNTHIINSGYLDVGDGHKIYFEEWGNPKIFPMFYLHGGPGGDFNETTKLLFDPDTNHVIFHSQRGCGKSMPYAQTKHNTTQDLIEDINKLSTHLNFETFNIIGGSWGSTLALLYALSYPEKINKMVLWSIYLARQFEMDWVNEGYPRFSYPEAWSRFISLVPKDHQTNGDKIMRYYAQQIRCPDNKIAKQFADEWTLWESTLLSIEYDKTKLEEEVLSEDNTSIAMLETHYFLHTCFIPENFILENISKINHIPCYVVHGRFDQCTPPISAYDLSRAYGKNLTLQFTNAGHLRTDPENFTALQLVFNTFL